MKEKNYKKEIINESITNGYFDNENSAMCPERRSTVTYINPKTGKQQTQNYLEMQDLVVPVIVKRDKNTGDLLFAMQYESIPSSIYNAQLELPDCPFFNKKSDSYTNEEVIQCIDKKMTSLGLEMRGYRYLDSSSTAINQSITDQMMKTVCVYVEDENEKTNNNGLVWYHISSLEDYLFNKQNDNSTEYSSLQTKYALRLFYETYKNDIKKYPPTKFNYGLEKLNRETHQWLNIKNVMKRQYRFGEDLTERQSNNEKIKDFGKVAEMGTSKNSVECLVVKKEGEKISIGLSRQQRSPFIAREGIDEFFYEEVGGMLEEGEDYQTALKREVPEETGIEIKNGKIIFLSNPVLLSKGTQECSAFYIYEMDRSDTQSNLCLDEQESIDAIEWFDLNKIDLNKLHAPLPTKYAILMAKQYYALEREKELNKEEER